MAAQRKRWLLPLATGLVSLTISVAAVEVIYGSWLFGANALTYLNVPRNLTLRLDTSRLLEGGGISVYHRDTYGLRGEYDTPSQIDVLAIGGSTTNELYVSEGLTWVDVLRRGLARRSRPLTVVNAGVDGHSTIGHIRSFDVWFPRISGLYPSYVIAYIGLNDVQVEAYQTYDMIESPTTWARMIRAVKNNSALVNLYRRFHGVRVVYGSGTLDGEFVYEQPERTDQDERYRRRLEAYEERLNRLLTLIREFGATPVLVTQPRGNYRVKNGRVYGLSPQAVDTYIVTRLFNDKTLQVCRIAGGICIDLEAELHFADGDFYDVNHTTPQGSWKIGVYLANKFNEALDHSEADDPS